MYFRLLVYGFLLLVSFVASAATPVQIDSARLDAVRWLIENQQGDGRWDNSGGAAVTGTASTLDGLRNAGVTGMPYARGLSWLVNSEARSIDGLSRKALAINSAGANANALIQDLLGARNERFLAWGTYPDYGPGFPDTALALDAIRATGTAYADAGTSLGFIVFNQNVDGGWSYAPNTVSTSQSRILPTAQTLITLIKYRNDGWGIQGYITAGINWLIAQQKVDGSFGDDTTGTVVETALAYLAISAELGTAHASAVAAEDFLIAQQAVDGSWNGDALQTALALQTLPTTALVDTDNDGVPDGVEILMGTNPLLADSRYLASGNGDGVAGTTLPTDISTINYNEIFSRNLVDTGGTGPFTWKIVAGSLPLGLTLNTSTGEISGTPTEAGTFSFIYEVTDSSQQTLSVVSQIVVSAPAFSADGDLNADGQVDIVDVLIASNILRGAITATPEQLIRGDVAPLVAGVPAPDGQFNLGDVLVITRKALGSINF